MGRRDRSILDELLEAPWWVSIVSAVGLFLLLRFIVPATIPANANFGLQVIARTAPQIAGWCFILLLGAPLAAFRQWRECRRLAHQTNLASIRSLSWQRFETLVAEAYRRQGYTVSRAGGNGPDGGVDLVLEKHGNTLLVQCKQWTARTVGVNVVLEVFGVMTAQDAHGAIILTSGCFTRDARRFAAGKPLDLIEGGQLAALIRAVQRLPVKEENPSPPPTAAAPLPSKPTPKKTCPKCGAEMVVRTARRGAHAGRQFWGCSDFPTCRATSPFAPEPSNAGGPMGRDIGTRVPSSFG